VDEVIDATTYLWIPHHVPPGTYDLVLMLSGAEGWLSLTHGDGSFGGISLPLGAVAVPALPAPASLPDLLPSSDPGWPGLRLLGMMPPEAEILAGQSLRVAIGLERGAGTPPAALSWMLQCESEVRQRDLAPWGPSAPDGWRIGARYTVVHALRVDPSLDLPLDASTGLGGPVV
jgi:hypothetical protein